MGISTKSTLKNIFLFNFDSFWAFSNLVTGLSTIVADIVCGFMFKQVLVEDSRLLEVFLDEYFRVMVGAFAALLAVPVHVVPAEFTDDVFVLALFA